MTSLSPPTLRTPRSAAVAGIAFALLFTASLALVRTSVPAGSADAGAWLADESRRRTVRHALVLVPFAGIAFLWFVAVVRDRVGDAEDRFFATVFLGSGLLFVAMFFTAAATAEALVWTVGEEGVDVADSTTWKTGRHVAYAALHVYGMRMAAVFTIAASTILRRTGAGPGWLSNAGYATAVILLVGSGFLPWLEVIFPAWVLVVSVYILWSGREASGR